MHLSLMHLFSSYYPICSSDVFFPGRFLVLFKTRHYVTHMVCHVTHMNESCSRQESNTRRCIIRGIVLRTTKKKKWVLCKSELCFVFCILFWGVVHVAYHTTVCCSVLQCVAVCCSVLQCVAVCCSVLQCVACGVPHNDAHHDKMEHHETQLKIKLCLVQHWLVLCCVVLCCVVCLVLSCVVSCVLSCLVLCRV